MAIAEPLTPTARQRSPWPVIVAWGGLGVFIAGLAVVVWKVPVNGFDSFSYLELAKTIGHDFYHVTAWRSFHSTVPYAGDFPPLWPLILSAGLHLPFGVLRWGEMFNLAMLIVLAALIERIARRHFGVSGIGPLATIVLLGIGPFLWTVLEAFTDPLSIVLVVLQVDLLLGRQSWRQWLLFGFVSGLMVMLHFDAILPALLCIAVLVLRNRRWGSVAWSVAGYAAAVWPWVWYSWKRFGVLFYSDNSWVATSVSARAYANNFTSVPDASLWQNPGAWLHKVGVNVPKTVNAVYHLLRHAPSLLLIAVVAILLWRFGHAQISSAKANVNLRWLALFFLVWFFGILPGILATGYSDTRYFSRALCLGTILLLVLIAREQSVRLTWSVLFIALLLVLSASSGIVGYVMQTISDTTGKPYRVIGAIHAIYKGDYPRLIIASEADNALLSAKIAGCLGTNPQQPRVMIASELDVISLEMPARTGVPTVTEPRNFQHLGTRDWHTFAERFHVGYVYFPPVNLMFGPGVQRGIVSRAFELRPVAACPAGMYTISPRVQP